MKRPEIIGWEVTTNENGVKMATLPRDTMEQIVKYIEYADKQLRLGDVSGRSEQFVCEHLHRTEYTHLGKYKCEDCGKWMDKQTNCH